MRWCKCLRIGNIKRYDAVICVSMNSCFKILSDAMIQFHTNSFAFVRKKQYKHRLIGHAKHTYPQIWTYKYIAICFKPQSNPRAFKVIKQFHVHTLQ